MLAVLRLATSRPGEALENLSLTRLTTENGEITYTYQGRLRGVSITLNITSTGRFRLYTSLQPAGPGECADLPVPQLAPSASCAAYAIRRGGPGLLWPEIDGVPVEPPIRVSCARPENGVYAWRVEGFLPPVDPARPQRVTVDDRVLIMAVEALACMGDRPPGPWAVRVESLSYHLFGDILAPVIAVEYNGSRARIALLPGGPRLLEASYECAEPRSIVDPLVGLAGLAILAAAITIYGLLRRRSWHPGSSVGRPARASDAPVSPRSGEPLGRADR